MEEELSLSKRIELLKLEFNTDFIDALSPYLNDILSFNFSYEDEHFVRYSAIFLGITLHKCMELYLTKQNDNNGNSFVETIKKLPEYEIESFQIKFICDLFKSTYTKIYSELIVGDIESKLTGTLDCLVEKDRIFYIYDWKRTNSFLDEKFFQTNEDNNKEIMINIKLSDIRLSHILVDYTIQLSIYRYLVKKMNPTINLSSIVGLVIFHPTLKTPKILRINLDSKLKKDTQNYWKGLFHDGHIYTPKTDITPNELVNDFIKLRQKHLKDFYMIKKS